MKKYKIKFLLLGAVMILLLSGCAKDTSGNAAGTMSAKRNLSKAEWIGILGDEFGYNQPLGDEDIFFDVNAGNPYYAQIQACAEWEVLPEQGKFEPDSQVSWKYAIETTVRAIGLERLERAGENVSESTLVDFFSGNIANIDQVDLSGGLSATDAEQMLDYAEEYRQELRYEQVFEYAYCEHVYEIEENAVTLKGDGRTAVINDGTSYAAGDVLVLPTTETSVARAIKVTDADAQELHYTDAELEEVYTDIYVSGSYEGRIISVEAADVSEMEFSYNGLSTYQALPCRIQGKNPYTASFLTPDEFSVVDTEAYTDENGAHFHSKFGNGGDFSVDITNIEFDVVFKPGWFKIEEAYAGVRLNDRIEISYQAEHFAKTIPLGKLTVAGGSKYSPISLVLDLSLNIGMDGEVSLVYTSSVNAEVGYRDGRGLYHDFENGNTNCDFHAMVTVTAEPSVKAALCSFSKEVANVKFTTGVVAIATSDVDFTGKQPSCTDIYMYVPFRWAINQDNCMITYFMSKARYEAVVWDSENSKITAHYHWEDGARTPDDQCTRKAQEVETPVVDEEGKPYDEYLIFDFEELDFAVIRVDTPSVYLEQGETLILAFTEIPGGYTDSDLVYEIDRPSVCTVSGGRITGVSGGSTVVKISTSDDKYSTYITVTVKGEFKDVSGFQSL